MKKFTELVKFLFDYCLAIMALNIAEMLVALLNFIGWITLPVIKFFNGIALKIYQKREP